MDDEHFHFVLDDSGAFFCRALPNITIVPPAWWQFWKGWSIRNGDTLLVECRNAHEAGLVAYAMAQLLLTRGSFDYVSRVYEEESHG